MIKNNSSFFWLLEELTIVEPQNSKSVLWIEDNQSVKRYSPA